MSFLSAEKRRLLAQRLKAKGLDAGHWSGTVIARRSRVGPAPLSFAQRRLWVLDQLEPGSPFYNIPVALRLRGPLDPALLARCFGEIARRHEALRTTFGSLDGEPFQVVAPPAPAWPLPVVDLRHAPTEAGRLIAEEALRPFDLQRGPLLRTTLLRLGGEESILLVTMHHIISDGWSNEVFQREMAALYGAFLAGQPSPFQELPIQYPDFAVWQREWLEGGPLEAQLAVWRARLQDLPAALDLPTDRPRPPLQSYRGARRPAGLPGPIADALRRIGREEGATSFMTFLAAFAALLGRLAGQDDLAIGSPVANRRRVELEGLIGFFVNTLVFRMDLAGGPGLRALLRRVRDVAREAYAHQDVPFEKLVEELQPVRDLSRSPLFQVMFTLDDAASAGLNLPGLEIEPVSLEAGTAKFDLTLSLFEGGPGAPLTGVVEFATDLFDDTTAERIAGWFRVLATAAADHPETPWTDLPLLDDPERHQLLHEWNDVPADPLPEVETVIGLLAARARETPDAIAVDGLSGSLTFRELTARARGLARRLAAMGVGPEVRVGVCLERTPEALVALLAVLEAGGAFVPLAPSDPAERLAWVLADSGVPLLLATKRTAAALPPHGARVLGLDELPGMEDGPPLPEPNPASTAYVIYTSGSTGRPKGVMVSHGALLGYAVAVARRTLLPSDRVLAFAPMNFDVFLEEVFPPWAAGAATVLDDPERTASVFEISRVLAERRATVLNLPAAFWIEWHGHLLRSGERPPECLRFLAVGNESVPSAPAALWRGWGIELANAFGLTESTVTSTFHFVGDPGDPRNTDRPELPIGRPVANTRLHVLDLEMRPVPIGVTGEIAVGGTGVARGYLNRPDLTAERFVPDPFGPPGSRLYRTGDLGRWGAGGSLDFLGRRDRQVKIRGFRVETDEVASVLASHPEVRQAVVVARGQQLVAYCVGEPADLREWLRARLPEYMVPAFVVPLEALPLTPSGKIDRKALPAPVPGARVGPEPRTPAEQILADLWADLLGVEQVGARDGFFERGGHSLLATRLVSRLRERGIDLPLAAVFEHPVLADLAARIDQAGSAAPPPPLTPSGDRSPAPLSFAQQRLWFLDRLEPGSTAYNLSAVFRLEGALDVSSLQRAMTEIARRHESLRTVFALEGTEPVQVVLDPAPVPLPVVDASGEDAPGVLWDEARRPFDLARGPLLRLLLLRLAPEEHVVSVAMHHIVSDGWSMGVFMREAVALYAGQTLPEPRLQYSDFARWQRGWLDGEALAAQLRFWQGELEGAPTVLEVPADRPRPAVQSFRGAQRTAELPEPLGAKLRALARREGATLFMTLLAAFQALLGRTAGQDHLLVGSPVANRHRVEVEDLIGFFVNTLVLRGDLRGDPTFRELLGRVRARSLAAWSHQDLPFERLVEELKIERSLSRNPLFQVMFTLEVAPPEMPGPAGLALSPLAVDSGTAKADLLLGINDLGDRLAATWEYATDLFDAATVGRLAERLTRLLSAAVEDPEVCLADLPLLGAEEREQVLADWNDTASAYPREACVHELFAEQAARAPEAVALELGDLRMTYGELDARSDRLARRLRRQGVGPEVPVALAFDRSPDLIVAMLGVLKAGGFYVPLDPAQPEERRAVMLADAGAALVLDSIDGEEGGPLESVAAPGNLAYVLYTSGSTGMPKGVAVTHRNVVRLVRGSGYADLGPEETFLQLAPVSFDASTFEIWGALLNGGRLVLFPGERASLDDIAGAVARHGVTTLWLTAGLFHQMVDHRLEGLRPLRQLLAGGDALAPARVRRVLEALPGLALINGYGPTEGTTFTCCHPMREPGEAETPFGTVPIGRPIANARVYVLDLWGRPAPPGVAGELWAGGDGVARGYLGRPDLTAERFVPDPFAEEPGERLYRTGDLVRWLPDGAIEFLGRIDQQVKIRGFRVEPGEIEVALRAHPAVRDAAVVVREGTDPADRRLAACVASSVSAGVPSRRELRDFLRSRLPEALVPSDWVFLEALPLTPTGKVDRRALGRLAAEAEAGGGESAFVPPRTPAEQILADLWADLLGVERVGARDGFFERGGHSLLATRLVSRLRERGIELPLQSVFESPVLADLAARIDQAGSAAPLPPLTPSGDRSPAPLSFAQQRLWFLDRLEPGSTAYNLSVAFRLEGPLDVPALERAMTEIARRHESLRTVFALEGTEPVQVVLDPAPIPLPVVEAGDLQGLLEEEARRPFDLAQGPLLRVLLLRLGPEEYAVSVAMHHIVSDGWSMGVFVREAVALYSGEVLPELPLQYPDYARWQRGWLEGEALAAQLRFWQEALEGAPMVLEVPADRPRPAMQSFRGAQRTAPLPEPLAAGLRALARREGATLFMTLLAAFQALLGRTAGQDDLLVGSPVANRHRTEVEDLIGFFVNTLVLRGDLRGDPSFREMLGRVRTRSLAAWAHQDLPFERLVEELKVERSLSRNPLFQVMFTLEVQPPEMPSPAGLALTPLAVDSGTAKADLMLGINDLGDLLATTWEYATDLFDAATIDRFGERLTLLLEAAVEDPEARLSDLPLMGVEEREQILGNWNDTSSAYPWEACVHELFAAQAARTPGAVALEFGDLEMTYGELDARSDRLARRLRRQGVGPEVPVALSFGRSADLIVAILGVLKAGGFYVPLDPAQPEERRAVVLADSGAAILLDSVEGEEGEPLASLAGPENLAYVMYTSGSTGMPKGVAVTHRNIIRLVRGTGYAGLGPEQTFLQLAPAAFDASTFEIWGALLNGGRLVLFPGERASLDEIVEAIARHGVTTLWLTAGLFHQMVDHRLEGLRPLRQLLAGGDTLAPARVRRVLEELPGLTLINGYGPTEGTTFTCCHPMREPSESVTPFGTVPIGRPIANARVYGLDFWGQPAPPGVPGELWVGGDGVARGYLGRPDLTAERFTPFTGGERLYRTGDLVRFLPDGAIEFLGRIDNQIKIRGFRVEPGEVEAVLAGHPEVRQAAVLVRDRELVAYVAGEGEELPARLQRFLGERLPDPMVPRAWVLLPALPLTPNGKVDRRGLAASDPVPGRAESGTPYVAPRTPLEAKLAEAWAEILGIERVGLHDNFFQLGGHSLLATQLVAELERRWHIVVPLKTLFEASTLGDLAERVTERELEQAGGEDLTEFLDEIEGLSPEELRALLSEEGTRR